MDQLLEFPLAGGGIVLVKTAEPLSGSVPTRGRLLDRQEDLRVRVEATFEDTLQSIRPAAEAILGLFTNLAKTPDEINVEFAVEISAQAGAFIATLGSTANFRIALSWRRPAADERIA
jgi:Trypsin-co-occurring domain 1